MAWRATTHYILTGKFGTWFAALKEGGNDAMKYDEIESELKKDDIKNVLHASIYDLNEKQMRYALLAILAGYDIHDSIDLVRSIQ